MCRMHPKDHERIGKIFNPTNPNMLWSDYERMLGELDVSKLVERNIDTWTNIKNRHEFENPFDTLGTNLISYFQEWVIQIRMSCANQKRLKLDNKAYFINFNYTPTLECLYNIPQKQICYIHGDTCKNECCAPIVGHGNNNYEKNINDSITKIKDRINELKNLPSFSYSKDDFTELIVNETRNLLTTLKKDTATQIKYNMDFFKSIASSDEIYVLGHSLADVDSPYFEKIAKESPNAKWFISYYNEKEKIKAQAEKISCLNPSQIKYIALDDLR